MSLIGKNVRWTHNDSTLEGVVKSATNFEALLEVDPSIPLSFWVPADECVEILSAEIKIFQVVELINEYAYYDGDHHKDWVFGKIMDLLKAPHEFEGVAP